ncbi:hypothetical protein [Rhodococcus xishaensis]|uniref:Excisionase n=1 Tax=Rhodococcus xishaensis TaxID=2487364 RepID=A0A438AWJ4_9NOCA|nr:hypothetical protein [Rhodococcus xishaensis]RVW03032.1 hypothetical protein EGT50_10005 [Rhodococcus xishaensis]
MSDVVLNIHQVSARTGHSADRIRHLRVDGHELYSLMWKNGPSHNSPLLLEERLVEEWVASQRARTIRPEAARYRTVASS